MLKKYPQDIVINRFDWTSDLAVGENIVGAVVGVVDGDQTVTVSNVMWDNSGVNYTVGGGGSLSYSIIGCVIETSQGETLTAYDTLLIDRNPAYPLSFNVVNSGDGSAVGQSVCAALSVSPAKGSAAGSGTAYAYAGGAIVSSAVGTSAGSSSVSGVGFSGGVFTAAGSSAGTSSVSAYSPAGGYSPDVSSPFFANDTATLMADVTTGYNAVYDATTNSTYVAHQAYGNNGSTVTRFSRVQRYDHGSDTWSPNYNALLSDNVGDDDHGTPSLEIDGAGYVHVFGDGHNQPIQHAYSNSVRNVSAWTAATQISPVGDSQNYGFSYPRPTYTNGKMYVFMRKAGQSGVNNSTSMPYSLVIGTGNGSAMSFAADRTMIDLGNDSRCYAGQHVLSGGKIYFAMTRANSADTQRQDVYVFVYDPVADTISNFAGTTTVAAASFPVSRTQADASFLVINQTASGTYGTIPCMAQDAGGLFHLIYADAASASTALQAVSVKHCYAALGAAFSTPTTIATQKMRNDRFCIVANPTTGGVDAFVTIAPSNTSIPWGNANGQPGGDMALIQRTSGAGGTWGTQSTILVAGYQACYDSPVPVRNATGALYCTVGEFIHPNEPVTGGQANSVFTAAGGVLRSYAVSTSGLKTCRKPYQTTAMAAYMARRTTTPSATMVAYIDELLFRLSDLSYLPDLDALYLLAMDNSTDALLNLVQNNFNLTSNGTLTFTAGQGFKGDGATGYLNTNFAASTAAGQFTQNSAMIGAFTATEGQEAKQLVGVMTTGTTPNVLITPRDTSNKINVRLNDTSTQGTATNATVASAIGHILARRNSSASETVFRNGSSVATGTTASVGPASSPITLLKNDVNFSTRQISYAFIGNGTLAANDAIFMSSIMNRYTGTQGLTNA